MKVGRNYPVWLDGEEFAVLCYSKSGSVTSITYFDYLFDAQTFSTIEKATNRADEIEIIRVVRKNITDED